MLWELRWKNILSCPWICFAPQFNILRPSLLSITLTQPYRSLWIWNSLKGCRICPLMSTWTSFIKIPHFHQYHQHSKWSLLKIVAYSHYIKWSFLLLFCSVIYWGKYVQYWLKLVLIRMKFSLCGVDLILTKPPNKRSTTHIAAHILPS